MTGAGAHSLLSPTPREIPGGGGGGVEVLAAGRHAAVIDLGYGDAGKGTTTAWLCEELGIEDVVRYSGGGQAAHNVVTSLSGREVHHTFAQLGAGSFSGARTWLSRFVLVEPLALASEAAALAETLGTTREEVLAGVSIEREALLTTPYHRAANQERERRRGRARHGSCGMGIGETKAYELVAGDEAPRVGDISHPQRLAQKLARLRAQLEDELGELEAPMVQEVVGAYEEILAQVSLVERSEIAALLRGRQVVFEGAQGVLLDEWRGFHPHTTWSTTTAQNCDTLCAEAGVERPYRMGVIRPYTTRHGAGPLVSEDSELVLPEAHNLTNPWQEGFRLGHLDAVAHRYAVEVIGGVDGVMLTHLDRVSTSMAVCEGYEVGGTVWRGIRPGPWTDLVYQEALTEVLLRARPVLREAGEWVEEVEAICSAPVVATSFGAHTQAKAWQPVSALAAC